MTCLGHETQCLVLGLPRTSDLLQHRLYSLHFVCIPILNAGTTVRRSGDSLRRQLCVSLSVM